MDKKKLDELIAHQTVWIKQLSDAQDQLLKYRDGTLPISENQIDQISNAQAQLAQAVTNIANAIRRTARK